MSDCFDHAADAYDDLCFGRTYHELSRDGGGYSYRNYSYAPRPVTCNRCGKGGLTWGNDGRGWYLIDLNGYEHVCQTRDLHKMAGDDFEVLE